MLIFVIKCQHLPSEGSCKQEITDECWLMRERTVFFKRWWTDWVSSAVSQQWRFSHYFVKPLQKCEKITEIYKLRSNQTTVHCSRPPAGLMVNWERHSLSIHLLYGGAELFLMLTLLPLEKKHVVLGNIGLSRPLYSTCFGTYILAFSGYSWAFNLITRSSHSSSAFAMTRDAQEEEGLTSFYFFYPTHFCPKQACNMTESSRALTKWTLYVKSCNAHRHNKMYSGWCSEGASLKIEEWGWFSSGAKAEGLRLCLLKADGKKTWRLMENSHPLSISIKKKGKKKSLSC